jgi:ERCC4-related helicase
VLENWPARWLVADDVGLGKTIEAGLILWPLVSRGTVRRFLIVCPASLVEQWQQRLREMFDIRTTRYAPEVDTPRADFWNSHDQVIASLQTLRVDNSSRHERLLSADPWDLLLVDEAHHLNADEQSGPTLGYKLVEQLVTQRQVKSVVFFTGTPHRGKDFGFFSLMRLLRPELFDPRKPMSEQLPRLKEVMIRNNKQNVTDMHGERIFWPPFVTPETYEYSPPEARFYSMLTEFILTGKAYASSLGAQDSRMVMLVLIAMQKLASSSVAAIRRALRRRLERLIKGREDFERRLLERQEAELRRASVHYEELETEDTDAASKLEEELASSFIHLMADEEPRLRELLQAADEVAEETKVNKILSILDSQFADRPVLMFTEYKATQSLLMSALNRRYGDGCVTFINGDDVAEEVRDSGGTVRIVRGRREEAADQFNSGLVRFLVSTEAGGEGIDLQERCHSLIHVDLPWNPMRLHQRVGRLNRYGQTHRVDVVHLRNPDTVEARIWDKLNQKIDSIMAAFSQVMDEPEDLLQLVLGMTSPSLFRELFSEADSVPGERLSEWFDQKTARFGGQDALEAVRALVGYASKFDFQQASELIPQIDLPALAPFLKTMLSLNGRQVRDELDGLSFRTPEAWLDEPGVRSSYEHLHFDRQGRSKDAAERVVGVGHKVLDQALKQAGESPACVASLPAGVLPRPLVLFTITDSVTTEGMLVRSILVGVELPSSPDETMLVLRDWEALEKLNTLSEGRGYRRARESARSADPDAVIKAVEQARAEVEGRLPSLQLPFRLPEIALSAVLWPDSTLLGQGSVDA